MEVKNRIEVPPMGGGIKKPDLSLHPDFFAYIRDRAMSGAGIVTVPDVAIDTDRAASLGTNLAISGLISMPDLSFLADEIKRHGAKASIELTHYGRVANIELSKGKIPYAPSDVPAGEDLGLAELVTSPVVEVMDHLVIKDIIEKYVRAAYLCMTAGYDMIMIHAAHGQLPAQFLSPATNKRTDKYGGSIRNRTHFLIEMLQAIRGKCGNGIAIELRISGTEFSPEGLVIEEVIEILKMVQGVIDLAHISAGLHPGPFTIQPYYLPKMFNVHLAAKVKKELDIPVAAVGSINSLEDAEDIIAKGLADIVAMGRPALADPRIFVKGSRGQEDRIRPCTRCLKCGRVADLKRVGCTVNPVLGRESMYSTIHKTDLPKKAMIIGGGPAGMQAALTCRERGHEVVLYEQKRELGGMLPVASSLPFKQEFRNYQAWIIRETLNCGTKVCLNTKVTPELIKEESPDVVIVAIGAEPHIPAIVGIDGPNVVSAINAYMGKAVIAQKVAVAGAGHTGCEYALALAQEGKDVSLIDRLPLEQWAGKDPFLRGFLMESSVRKYDRVKIQGFTSNSVKITDQDWEDMEIEADTIVLAFGVKALKDEVKALISVVPESYVIGDCYCVGDVYTAVHSGFNVAVEI